MWLILPTVDQIRVVCKPKPQWKIMWTVSFAIAIVIVTLLEHSEKKHVSFYKTQDLLVSACFNYFTFSLIITYNGNMNCNASLNNNFTGINMKANWYFSHRSLWQAIFFHLNWNVMLILLLHNYTKTQINGLCYSSLTLSPLRNYSGLVHDNFHTNQFIRK